MFKGGFVLRHAFGVLRFSKDVDATRDKPAKQRFDAREVAETIRRASIGDQLRFDPGTPATDSARSLDFASVKVSGALLREADVQVEVSYREEVVDPPLEKFIGEPFYDPFPILVMQLHEMAAEKLRTLAQRARETDLADLAVVLSRAEARDDDIARVAVEKFKLVARGNANRVGRIQANIQQLAADYDDVVPPIFPDAPSYKDAVALVWPRLKPCVPG